jgi:hypothetical protein
MPHLRVVPDELWASAHARLRGSRETYLRSTGGRLEGRPPNAIETAKYLLAGLARCAVCGGGMTARTRQSGARRVPFYECLTHRQRGAAVCGNRLQLRADLAEAAVLQTVEATLLTPTVTARAITLALQRLRPSTTPAQRTQLEAEQRRLDAARTNFVAAIARGGDLDALVTALKTTEQQLAAVTLHLSQLDAVTALTQVDTAALITTLTAKVKEWGGLARRHPAQGRQILRKLLADRLVFTPTEKDGAPAYEITGEGQLGPLLAGALPAHAPSSAVLQRWWPQRDSNPCFSHDHVFAMIAA